LILKGLQINAKAERREAKARRSFPECGVYGGMGKAAKEPASLA